MTSALTSKDRYHTAVIGAGSGGLTVGIGLSALGRRVAVIEGNAVGGDCTNVGCIPSKSLIHLVNAHGGQWTPAQIFAEVRAKRDALRDKETHEVGHTQNLDLIFGWARFRGPKRLQVSLREGGQREIEAKHIVIASGSRPHQIEIPGLPPKRSLTNETLFDLTEAPKHLVIVGAGVVAMEMASAFRKLGSAVTILARSERVLSSMHTDVSTTMQIALAANGTTVLTLTQPVSYDAANLSLCVAVKGRTQTLVGVDYVLQAIGRDLNIDKLDLDKAGIPFDEHGIHVDPFGQTRTNGVFAIGDVTPTSHHTHSANAQGRRVSQRIHLPLLPAFGREPLFPTAIFSDPEVAHVGMSAAEIAMHCHPNVVLNLRFEMKDLDRGYTDQVEHGFVLVQAIRLTGTIIGATLIGPRATELISVFTLAIERGISLFQLYRIVYPYPTFAGGIGKIADAFMRNTLPNLPRELLTYIRYRFAKP